VSQQIEKYNQISNLLIDYDHNKKIYDESIKKEIRLYILNDKNNELLIDKFF
jgi:hypothetical protein